jgi:phosphohistidine phosphatase
MDLFFVRHAKAIEKGDVLDEHRYLTAKGRRDALHVGKVMRRAGVQASAIVTSPLVRAVQTAELIAEGLHFDEAIEVAPELLPNHTAQSVIESTILPRLELGSVLLVGHEPQLGLILRTLLKSAVPSPRKAAAVHLTLTSTEEAAQFRWVVRADQDDLLTRIDDIG